MTTDDELKHGPTDPGSERRGEILAGGCRSGIPRVKPRVSDFQPATEQKLDTGYDEDRDPAAIALASAQAEHARIAADHDDPPPEVLALIELGQPRLRELQAERTAQQEAMLDVALDAALRVLEAEAGYFPAVTERMSMCSIEPHETDATLQIDLPGCATVLVRLRRLRGDNAFKVLPGFWVHEYAGEEPTVFPTLAVAAAAAREVWLADQHEAEMLVGGGPVPTDPRPTEAEWREIAREHHHANRPR
jgi:hypothetical protein